MINVLSDEFINSCDYLGLNPSRVIKSAQRLSIIAFLTLSLSFLITNWWLIISLSGSLMVYYYLTEKPKRLAVTKRLRALGHAPEVITLLSTSLELNPSLEEGFKVVGLGVDELSGSFAKAYKESIINGKPLIESFNEIINEWGSYSQPLRNGLRLIYSSLSSDGFSEGVSVFFNSLINNLKSFLSRVKVHTLLLFSFGTVLPLIIISLMPMFNFINNDFNGYWLLIINLVIIKLYSDYILNNKPASFSQLSVGEPRGEVVKSVIIGLIISSPTIIHYLMPLFNGSFPMPEGFSGAPLIIGLTIGLTNYYYTSIKGLIDKRSKALQGESELLDVIYSIGVKLRRGVSFEKVLSQLSSGVINKHLRTAYKKAKELGVNINETIIKELRSIGSARIASVFKLVTKAVSMGVNGSAQRVFRIYQHYNKMVNAEKEHQALISQVLSMMKLTAVIFAPLISAFIVIMQGLMINNLSSNDLLTINNTSIDWLVLILGLYTIGLTHLLTVYLVRVSSEDEVSLNKELMINTPLSVSVYLMAVIIGLALL